MATYKVIQDIEAEDKLIGPFGIRQFIYLIIIAVSLFIGFQLSKVSIILVLPLLPHILFFALLALPFGGEQPTETWLLAKIRFALKPRVRVWDQDGIQELVTITAPKKIERNLTKSMSQGEVQSRLKALANTIDSRGWAIKNVNMDVFQPALAGAGGSDRLLSFSDEPVGVSELDPRQTPDMFDEGANPVTQKLDQMISASSKSRREQIISTMKQGGGPSLPPPTSGPSIPPPPPRDNSGPVDTTQPDYWFLNNGGGQVQIPGAAPVQNNLVTPDPSTSQQMQGRPLAPLGPQPGVPLTEDELLDKIHTGKQNAPKSYGHMKVIKTLEEQEADARADAARKAAEEAAKPPVTPAPDPDIIELARNDDLNVETVARQANKSKQKNLPEDGEVVINLH